jgi:hypothetical protein
VRRLGAGTQRGRQEGGALESATTARRTARPAGVRMRARPYASFATPKLRMLVAIIKAVKREGGFMAPRRVIA